MSVEMTRGEMLDHLARFCAENETYKRRLLANPKDILSRQFGLSIPDHVSVSVVEDTAHTIHLVLPHVVAAGDELSDADLEAVAGGMQMVKRTDCAGGAMTTFNAIGGSSSAGRSRGAARR